MSGNVTMASKIQIIFIQDTFVAFILEALGISGNLISQFLLK